MVSGVVGLLLSAQRQAGQRPDPLAARAALLESAHPCDPVQVGDCRRFLAGSLHIAGAYEALMARGEPAAAPGGPGEPAAANPGARDVVLNVGDAAPDFAVEDHTGQVVRLSDYRGRPVVLWFYPRAATPD